MVMGHELTHGFDDRGNSFISCKMTIILGGSFVLVWTPSRESIRLRLHRELRSTRPSPSSPLSLLTLSVIKVLHPLSFRNQLFKGFN